MKFMTRAFVAISIASICVSANLFLPSAEAAPKNAKKTVSAGKAGNVKSAVTPNPAAASTAAPPAANQKSRDPLDLGNLLNQDKDSKNEPTYINSNTLTLNNEKRIFQYTGNVQVKHGEMGLSAEVLDGKYDENNQISELVARRKVVITKGDTMKATCERAVYDARARIVTLFDNPQLDQNGSSLSADVIKVFMDENRSVAEGQVRVKVVKKELKSAGTEIKQ